MQKEQKNNVARLKKNEIPGSKTRVGPKALLSRQIKDMGIRMTLQRQAYTEREKGDS